MRDVDGIGRRQKYRNSALVTAEMLEAASGAGREGIRFTHLIQKANLTTERTRRMVGNLVTAGLLADRSVDGGRVVSITPRGLEFLGHCRRFMDLADSFGVDL